MDIDQERVILIVTGAHLRAEAGDRPIAYHLRQAVLDRLADPSPVRVLVCSDLWYLNQPELRERPTVSVGAPGVNALTAYLGDKLPPALAVEGRFVVQFDAESGEAIAACWGQDGPATAAAVEAFIDRYLGVFLGSAGEGTEDARRA